MVAVIFTKRNVHGQLFILIIVPSKRKKNTETPSRKKTPFKKKNINEKIEKNNLTIKLNENKSSENVIN